MRRSNSQNLFLLESLESRISQCSISMSVRRGEQIAETEGHSLLSGLKLKNITSR